MQIKNLVLAQVESYIIRYKHYKFALFSKIFAILITILSYFLTSKYLKEIMIFYGKEVTIFYFLIVSVLIGQSAYFSFREIVLKFYSTWWNIFVNIFGKLEVLLSTALFSVIRTFTDYFLYLFLFFLFISQSFFSVFLVILASTTISLIGLSLAFILTPLLLRLKGSESSILLNYADKLLYFLIPVHFSVSILPKSDLFEILFPSIGIMEEIRKWLLLGINYVKFNIILTDFIVLFIYLYLSYKVFVFSFNYARRRGWVGLR